MSTAALGSTFVVVGGGEAGGRAASHLREGGFAGRLVLVCGESRLPYERPALSKQLLASENAEPPLQMAVEDYAARAIEIVRSTAYDIVREDKRLILRDGSSLPYDKLLLCCGAEPRRLVDGGGDLPGVIHLREATEAIELRRRLAKASRVLIVGGGFIGLEVAASARKQGLDVVLIEKESRLMARAVPGTVSETFARLHRDQGVALRFGVHPVAFLGAGKFEGLRLSDGSVEPAELALIGIGVAPRVELAQRAGLELGDGIRVDALGRTSDPHVFAAGDAVCQFNPWAGKYVRLECWQSARDQAERAADAMLDRTPGEPRAPWMWSDQFEHGLQILGIPRLDEGFVMRGDPAGASYTMFQLNAGRLHSVIAVNRSADMAVAKKIMAAAILVEPESLRDEALNLKSLVK